MAIAKRLLAKLGLRSSGITSDCTSPSADLEALVRAHGDWLALLSTILEREQVIAGNELARSLREFAAQTAADRPAEGRILSFWAACLQDTSAALDDDLPALH